MRVKAKICGLRTSAAIHAAVDGGAGYVGFVFYEKSPRHLTINQAVELAEIACAAGVGVVALTVDASDTALEAIASTLKPDLVQLHGSETPARALTVGAITGARIIKALRVREAADLEAAGAFEAVADHLMFDAKPPLDAALPGGNGAAFDWTMLAGRTFAKPWFLAGGLDASNVAEAVRVSGAPMVDVSSGVESAPGVKDPALIAAFLKAVSRA